jgi:hypothetical protein
MTVRHIALYGLVTFCACPNNEPVFTPKTDDFLTREIPRQRTPCSFGLAQHSDFGRDEGPFAASRFAGCEAYVVKGLATSTHSATAGRPPRVVSEVLEVLSGKSRAVGERLDFIVSRPLKSELCGTGIREAQRANDASSMTTPERLTYLVVGGFAPNGGPFVVNETTMSVSQEPLRGLVLATVGRVPETAHAAALKSVEDADLSERVAAALAAKDLEALKAMVAQPQFASQQAAAWAVFQFARTRQSVELTKALIARFEPNSPFTRAGFASACRAGPSPVVDAFFEANVPLEPVQGSDGPLHEAAAGGHRDLVERLLKAGASVHALGSRGPVIRSAVDHVDVMRLLLEAGAAVDADDGHGTTTLMDAVYSGRLETVKLLVAKGARASRFSRDGHSLAWMARDKPELRKFLELHGARLTSDEKREMPAEIPSVVRPPLPQLQRTTIRY